MFDSLICDVELWGGESEDELSYLVSVDELSSGWEPVDRQELPGNLASWLPSAFLAVVVAGLDRSKLNGFDLVEVLKARQRLISRLEADLAADMVEVGHTAPGDADSDVRRLEEAFEFASDEIRAALVQTRRSAQTRYDTAVDLVERLPRVHALLHSGEIDLARARVFVRGTAHLPVEAARGVVDRLADEAAALTTGQLAARIRRLAITIDPDDARRRYDHAVTERRLWMEQTTDLTGNLHLLDLPIEELRAIGRRVNGHMISLKKEDRSGRTHDQLRADIAVDMLLGSDAARGGGGLVDIQVELTTLAGLDENPAVISGLGPVVADVARQVADRQHRGEWRARVTERGGFVDVFTIRRRPTASISRIVDARYPNCTFPGCRMPARDCDYDHLDPWSRGGETSPSNLAPACRHDHRLRDRGWSHRRDGEHRQEWTSPLGHTYITQGQSP